ncbi:MULTISPECIES: hypothetical protein [unclassified Luteibacter]|uniref:hypothetical protein n=1 Tax=Luteibacter sp. PvP019 TaxID=3156436 RepID=UPI003397905D
MSEMSSREDLLETLKVMGQPKKHGLTQGDLDQILINFCAKCPDPVRARWLVVECLDPMTDEELVDRILNMPILPMADVPTSVVPAEHPARKSAQ